MNHSSVANPVTLAGGALGVSLMLMNFANAQAIDQNAQAIDEIVVTADKRRQVGIQDIPISVQALEGAALEDSGALDFMDYYRQVPGLSVNNYGPGNKQYIIRGIQSGGAGTVGVYFGEIIVTGGDTGDGGRQTDIKLFDMERIEILKGPQGTTFGSSSLSGTIRFIPNEPEYDRFAAEIGGGTTILTSESADIGWRTDAMINVPVIENELAVRVSGLLQDKAGYLDNRFADDANSLEAQALRGMLSWMITDGLELSALGMVQDFEVGARNFFNDRNASLPLSETLNGQDLPDYYQAVSTPAGWEEEIRMYNVKLVLDKPWGAITGTHSSFDRFSSDTWASDFSSEVLFGLPADEMPGMIVNDKDRQVVSSEMRFASNWDSSFQILVGGFYQTEERIAYGSYVFPDPNLGRVTPATPVGALDERATEIETTAAFGEGEWTITDRLTLTGGARWFDRGLTEQQNTIIQYIFQPGPGLEDLLVFDEDDVIFMGNLSYEIGGGTLLFTRVAEGFRAGGANDEAAEAITDVEIPSGFGSDSLINYEIGLKTAWFDSRLRANGAIYYIDWDDIQVEQQATNSQGLSFGYRGNGGGAEVRGFELVLSAFPTDGLRLGAGVAYTDAKLVEDMPIPSNGIAGDQIPYTPEYTAYFNMQYEAPILDDWTGFVAVDMAYRGETVNRFRPDDPFYRVQDSYTITNLRAGVEVVDDWSAILSIENISDADDIIAYTYDFQFPPIPGERFLPDNKVRPWPRTVSIMLRKQFF